MASYEREKLALLVRICAERRNGEVGVPLVMHINGMRLTRVWQFCLMMAAGSRRARQSGSGRSCSR